VRSRLSGSISILQLHALEGSATKLGFSDREGSRTDRPIEIDGGEISADKLLGDSNITYTIMIRKMARRRRSRRWWRWWWSRRRRINKNWQGGHSRKKKMEKGRAR